MASARRWTSSDSAAISARRRAISPEGSAARARRTGRGEPTWACGPPDLVGAIHAIACRARATALGDKTLPGDGSPYPTPLPRRRPALRRASWRRRPRPPCRRDTDHRARRLATVPTGIVIELPPGTEAQVRPRSGLAHRHGVTVLNAPGTIDEGYRGEVGVILINHGPAPFEVTRGRASRSWSCSGVSRSTSWKPTTFRRRRAAPAASDRRESRSSNGPEILADEVRAVGLHD